MVTSQPIDLETENQLVVMAVQSLLGLISSNVIAVAIRGTVDVVHLAYWVKSVDAETQEDADDALGDLDALVSNETKKLVTELHEGPPPKTWQSDGYRMIYWLKNDPRDSIST